MNDQARRLKERLTRPEGTLAALPTVVVAGGRAGAGATTIAVGLAEGLVRLGGRPLLVDRCGEPGDAGLRLGLSPAQLRAAADEPVLTGGRVRLLRAPAARHGAALVQHRLEAAAAVADLAIVDAEPDEPGLLELCRRAALVLVVATPDPATTAGAYGLLKRLARGEGPGPACALTINRTSVAGEAEWLAEGLCGLTRRFLGVEVAAWPTHGLAARLRERLTGEVFVAAARRQEWVA